MAIAVKSLEESILSSQERSVVRSIYKASQLAESLKRLDEISSMSPLLSQSYTNNSGKKYHESISRLKAYLESSIERILINTNVPLSPKDKATPQEVS